MLPMMKQLFLMRHAKSDRSEPGAEDHDRPLNARGRSAAPLMGEWLQHRGANPDEVLVSSAARTIETFDRLRRVMPALPRPRIESVLYLADAQTLLGRLRQMPETAATILQIGHEPGLGDFLRLIAAGDVPEHCRPAFAHFPTSAIAVLETDVAWADLAPGAARFVDWAIPRALAEN